MHDPYEDDEWLVPGICLRPTPGEDICARPTGHAGACRGADTLSDRELRTLIQASERWGGF